MLSSGKTKSQTEYVECATSVPHKSGLTPGNRPPLTNSVAGNARHRITYKAPSRNIEGAALAFAGHIPQNQTYKDIDDQISKRRSLKKLLTSQLLRCAVDGSTKRERPAMVYARELGPPQNVDEKTNYWSDEEVDVCQGNSQSPNTARSATQPTKTLERTLRNLVCRSAFGEIV